MKYLIYARVSPRGSDFEGETSIKMQIQYCREHIQKKNDGSTIYAELYDEFISGKNLERPSMKQIMAELKSGTAEWDCLCVYNLSRLTRNPRDMYAVMDALSANKKLFISISEPEFDFTSLAGEMLMGVISHVNQYVRKISGKNVKDKMRSIAKKGEWPSRVPFGYKRIEKHNNVLHIDERKAEMVRDMYEMYVGDRYEVHDINSKYKHVLTRNAIALVLQNPVYIGKIPYDGQIYNGKHEPIISQELFERAKYKRTDNKVNSNGDKIMIRPKAQKYPFLLSGLLRCHCGRFLTPGTAKSGEFAYYTCTDPECRTRKSAKKLEQTVWDFVVANKLKVTPKITKATYKELLKRNKEIFIELKPELLKLQQIREKIMKEKEKVFSILMQNAISESLQNMANEKLTAFDSELETIENRIRAIKQFDNDDSAYFEASVLYFQNICDFSEALAKAENKDAMRRVLSVYIDRIQFREDGMYQIKLNHSLLKSSTKESIWWA